MKIKHNLQPSYKSTEIGQDKGVVEIHNSFVDEFGVWRSFPGLSLFKQMESTSPVHLYWWHEKNYLIIITGTKFFYMETETSNPVEVVSPPIPDFVTISFTSTAQRLFFAFGSLIYTWLPGSDITTVSAGSPPTRTNRLAFLDNYIVANNSDDNLYYYAVPSVSDINAEPTWYPGDRAEGLPDSITAVDCQWRDLLLCGNRSIEIWYNAGNPLPASPFVRREGAFIHRGVIAPNTLRAVDNNWFFLDNERKITILAGNNFKVISSPFDEEISRLKSVEDAYSMKLTEGNQTWVIFVFPLENKSYAFEVNTNQWVSINEWYAATGIWLMFPAHSIAYAQDWSINLLGSNKNDGKIYKVDRDVHTFAGQEIRRYLRTAYFDHGTLNRKRCNSLLFRFKRGQPIPSGAGMLRVRWKNEEGGWSNYIEVPLNNTGETNFVVKLHRLGMYRARQWEYVITSSADLVMSGVEEDIEALNV